MFKLHLVSSNETAAASALRFLAVKDGIEPRTITVEEQDVPLPLISLLLGDFYQLGRMIETQMEYGLQVSARLDILCRGAKRSIIGAVVPLVGGPDLVLPIGFLERH